MDKSEVKAWIDENIEALLKEYGLPHWRLEIFYEVMAAHDEGFMPFMTCSFKPEYERACIRINYPKFEEVAELEEHLRHELCHILHSPFEIPYRAILALVKEEHQMEAINEMWRVAEEMTVRNLERMHHGHKTAYKAEA